MINPKKSIENINPYDTPKYAKTCVLKLDSNENPYGPSKEIIETLKELTPCQIGRYPHYGQLIDKVAQKYNVEDSNVLLTNGADEALNIIINAYLNKDEELLCFMPTFSMPELYANACEGKFRGVNYYTKWVFDADKLISQIQENTKLIYIASPNNPTGELAPLESVEKILSNFPNIGLILDVTYINFAQEDIKYWDLVKKYDNLFIVKSFSKDFAIAGLRLGILISNRLNIKECKKIISPYSVNCAAVNAGIAALCECNYEKFIKEQNNEARAILVSGLVEYGFRPYKSEANFVLCDFGRYCNFVYKKLESAGILVRKFNGPDEIKNCLRITVPRVQDIGVFFGILKKKNMLVFDLDGVVFDVSNSYRLAIKETFKYFAKKDLSDNEIQEAKDLGGLNCDWDLTKFLLKKHGFEISLEEVKKVFQQMFFNTENNNSKGLIDNEKLSIAPEIFEKLSDRYDFCVFTGRPKDETYYSLEKFGILKYFSKIITQDDLDPDKRKPHPEGLNIIKKETIYERIYYFGDTIDDIYAGVASNIETFGVIKKTSPQAKILLDAGASDIVDDISKLDEFIELKENTYANS